MTLGGSLPPELGLEGIVCTVSFLPEEQPSFIALWAGLLLALLSRQVSDLVHVKLIEVR